MHRVFTGKKKSPQEKKKQPAKWSQETMMQHSHTQLYAVHAGTEVKLVTMLNVTFSFYPCMFKCGISLQKYTKSHVITLLSALHLQLWLEVLHKFIMGMNFMIILGHRVKLLYSIHLS